MKKLVYLILILFLFLYCGSKQDEVERIMEDGVEVVINHLEPYEIKGESSYLELAEEIRIDFESVDFAEKGLIEPGFVDADSQGNIYVVNYYRSPEHFIYKFDKHGQFIKSFGQMGQGPGEIQFFREFNISNQDKIYISDTGNMKVLELDTEGNTIKETRIRHGLHETIALENDNILARRYIAKPSGDGFDMSIWLYNSDFQEIKQLDLYRMPELNTGAKNTGLIVSFYWRAANGKIYVGNEQRDYEIWIFDLEGNLIKKIRKEYTPTEYPEEFKKQTEKIAKANPSTNLVPAKYNPPFNSFFIDEKNRLFVMTYEPGESKEEYIHDIFNSDGIFIGRASIGISGRLGRALNHLKATAKNNRYYRLRYKENGYVELIVHKMNWE